jgi:hypothetical protein
MLERVQVRVAGCRSSFRFLEVPVSAVREQLLQSAISYILKKALDLMLLVKLLIEILGSI